MDGPVCARCKVTSSLMWEKNKEGEVLCLECYSNSRQEPAGVAPRSERPATTATPTTAAASPSNRDPTVTAASTETPSTPSGFTGRRTRLRNAKGRYGKTPAAEKAATKNSATPSSSSASPAPQQNVSAAGGSQSPAPPPPATQPETSNPLQKKGNARAGRRSLIKVTKPTKAPSFDATVVTSDTVLHKGTRYEVGDIVSILDENGRVYYALLRGFLEDQYAEKYAALTWLIPTTPNPKDFDPSLFVLGPEEDSPKDMECLDFVTHSPQSASFLPSLSRDSDLAKLWTGSKRRRVMFTS